MKTFIKIKEAVTLYNTCQNTFYNAIHNGELKNHSTNKHKFLLSIDEIDHWIKSRSKKEGKVTITHVLADGTRVDSIKGHIIPSGHPFYNIMYAISEKKAINKFHQE